jgi:hypothetical protein
MGGVLKPRIAVRFDSAKPAALFVIRRSIRDSGLAEYVALTNIEVYTGCSSGFARQILANRERFANI